MKNCPSCATPNDVAAATCWHCGRDLTVGPGKKYWFLVRGESQGPYSYGEIQTFATPDSLVSHGEDWVPAREHPDFRSHRWDQGEGGPDLSGLSDRHHRLVWKVVAIVATVGFVLIAVSLYNLLTPDDSWSAGAPQPQPTERPERPEVANAVIDYLADNFGVAGFSTGWYDNIVEVHVYDGTVEVATDLLRHGSEVTNICGTVSSFVYDPVNQHLGLRQVKVVNVAGTLLALRTDADGDCSSPL